MYNQECQTMSSGFRYDSPVYNNAAAQGTAASSTIQYNLDALEKSVAMLRESMYEFYEMLNPALNPESPNIGCGGDKASLAESPLVERIKSIGGVVNEIHVGLSRVRGRLAL